MKMKSVGRGGVPQVERPVSPEVLAPDADIVIKRVIGRGGFGVVFEGTLDGRRVAVKQFHTHHKNPAALLKTIETECNISLVHPNIVQVLGSYAVGGRRRLVMQYAGGHNLGALLNRGGGGAGVFSRRVLCFILLQVAKAMAFTHGHNLIHLDIKPANILVDDNFVCRLADFGCAQAATDGGSGHTSPTQRASLTGTYAYKSPEMLRGLPPTYKADIYAFGIVLNQLLTGGEAPYAGLHPHYVMFAVVSMALRPAQPAPAPDNATLRDITTRCWGADPASRPFSQELVELFTALHRVSRSSLTS